MQLSGQEPRAPLLTPKLRLPRLRSSLVFRERLLAQLDAGLERKLTLLLSSWLRENNVGESMGE